MSAAYFGNPAEKNYYCWYYRNKKVKQQLHIWFVQVLESVGIKTGLIGTIETIIGDSHSCRKIQHLNHMLYRKLFAEMVEQGCKCV